MCNSPDDPYNLCEGWCPWGNAMWTSYEFGVSARQGGAIATSGPLVVTISDSAFRANVAPKGASLSVTAATALRISNTTIDDPTNATYSAVSTVASDIDRCVDNPCGAGSKCTFRDFSTFCDACGENEVGDDGVSCTACLPGSQPDQSHTQCVPCAPGQYSEIGVCLPCPENSVPTGGGVACSECPARYEPSSDGTECVCKAGTFDAEALGDIKCNGIETFSDGLEDKCTICPMCMDCEVGETRLSRGWAFLGTGQAFECPQPQGCPVYLLSNITSTKASPCGLGYSGPVCGNCADGYNHLKVGNPCESCNDGVVNLQLVALLIVVGVGVGGVVISGAMSVLVENNIITDLRIIVGFYQILGQAEKILNLEFPFPVPQVVSVIKFLLDFVFALIRMDCWDIGGFYGRLVTNLVALPVLGVTICTVLYQIEKKSLMAIVAAGAADSSTLETLQVKLRHNLFVGMFLICESASVHLPHGVARANADTGCGSPGRSDHDYHLVSYHDLRHLRRSIVPR